MKAKLISSGLVYSTDSGRMCPDGSQPADQCSCRSASIRPATDGVVRVSRQTKGRAGKGVTLVTGVALAASTLLGEQRHGYHAVGGLLVLAGVWWGHIK